jgi:hypothetical protein
VSYVPFEHYSDSETNSEHNDNIKDIDSNSDENDGDNNGSSYIGGSCENCHGTSGSYSSKNSSNRFFTEESGNNSVIDYIELEYVTSIYDLDYDFIE